MPRRLPIWVFPTVLLAAGFVAGFALSRVQVGDNSSWSIVAYGGDADAARSLVSNVLTGIVSITTLTLTVTIVTLQLASSQYSPRLMKRYLRDRAIQLTVAYFLFSFSFTLPVLFHIRSGDGGEPFVPDVALTLVVGFSMLSLVGLVFFVAHVTRMIRVEHILERIAAEAIDRHVDGSGLRTGDVEPISDGARSIVALRSGFVTSVDRGALADAIGSDDGLWLDHGLGDYAVAGAPLAWVLSSNDAIGDDMIRAVDAAVTLRAERDIESEPIFGLRQISDIGVKALSPGVNDPTTAIISLGHAARVLVGIRPTDTDRSDTEPNVHVPAPSWGELAFSVFDQFATYGSGDAQVVRAMLTSIERLALVADGADEAELVEVLDSLGHHVAENGIVPFEVERLRKRLHDCRTRLTESTAPGTERTSRVL